MSKQFLIHFGLLIAAGLLVIVLLRRGIPQGIASVIGDSEQQENVPVPTAPDSQVVNTTPGTNQTYNLPNAPQPQAPASDAEYLTPGQLDAALSTQTPAVVQNVLSVGADYSEFVPASQAMEG